MRSDAQGRPRPFQRVPRSWAQRMSRELPLADYLRLFAALARQGPVRLVRSEALRTALEPNGPDREMPA